MVMHQVRQHGVPRKCRVIFGTLRVLVIAQETVGCQWELVTAKVREDMRLERNDVGKDVLAVQDLEGTQQVRIR